LLDQSKSVIPYGPDTENTEHNRGKKYGEQEKNDQFFLTLDGNL